MGCVARNSCGLAVFETVTIVHISNGLIKLNQSIYVLLSPIFTRLHKIHAIKSKNIDLYDWFWLGNLKFMHFQLR